MAEKQSRLQNNMDKDIPVAMNSHGEAGQPQNVLPSTQSTEEAAQPGAVGVAKTDMDPNALQHQTSAPLPGSALTKSLTAPSFQREPVHRGSRVGRRSKRTHRPFLSHGASYLDQAIQEGVEADDSWSSSSEDEAGPALGLGHGDGVDAERREGELMAADGEGAQLELEETEDTTRKKPYHRFRIGNENFFTKGKVKRDGRLCITVNETANSSYFTKNLASTIYKMTHPRDAVGKTDQVKPPLPSRLSSTSTAIEEGAVQPRLNIVIMVIGSRGDVQPFLEIGKTLKEQWGHRVRIATHPQFRDFVENDTGLEFFSVGGDPSELMAFMVKNPGMIPSLESVRAGDIGKRRAAMAEMFEGFWRACVRATDVDKTNKHPKSPIDAGPFVADAIIANPPSFAHVHCAEALGIPLHLMFTFPYTPTQAFPHPLASIKKSNVDPGYTNFISYSLVNMMVWQGLGDLVNDFRVKTLGLDPVSTLWAPGATYRMHVPFTYLWSPGLVPKPNDWGPEIDIAGFVFLDLATSFKPPQELVDFLDAGEPPVYIGFGSIVVDDPKKFTKMIFEAIKLAGIRALVSKGWGGLGGDETPDNIFMLENTPHDWLFPRVKACVIHGGAGTTAIALKCGLPTMVVPFFGDQYFWGNMIGHSGVGPEPVPYKQLTAEKLAEGIKYCLTKEAKEAAQHIARDIEHEGNGAENAARSFHKFLALRGQNDLTCSILRDTTAIWQPKGTSIRLSTVAADILTSGGYLHWKNLHLIRHASYNDFEGPPGPLSGIAGSIAATIENTLIGVGAVPYRMARSHTQKKKRAELKRQKTEAARAAATAEQNDSVEATVARTASVQTQSTLGGPGMLEEVTVGVRKTATAIAKAPVDLSVALAQGFHNAPRLYGDQTVRRPTRVTGMRSGLDAAREEFIYGVYDGWTGLVRQPVIGAKNQGAVGFMKGTGMGLTGFVVKNISAILGPVGYTLLGVTKQIERWKTPHGMIRRMRTWQGQVQIREMSPLEREATEKCVNEGWCVLMQLQKAISHAERHHGFTGHMHTVFLNKDFLFENVDVAKRALDALHNGEDLAKVIARERVICGRISAEHKQAPSPTPRSSTFSEQETDKKKSHEEPTKKNKKMLAHAMTDLEKMAPARKDMAEHAMRMSKLDGEEDWKGLTPAQTVSW